MCCVLLLFWSHDPTGQSELVTWPHQPIRTSWLSDLGVWRSDLGLVYRTREITLARMFFLAFGLHYDVSISDSCFILCCQLDLWFLFSRKAENGFPKIKSGNIQLLLLAVCTKMHCVLLSYLGCRRTTSEKAEILIPLFHNSLRCCTYVD